MLREDGQLVTLHAATSAALVRALEDALSSGQFVGGAAVSQFEHEWASYCGSGQCVGTSSGTAALQLTLEGLGIGRDDEVLVPANTFFGCVAAVLRAGATPVYCDVDPRTLLVDVGDAESRITSRTRALLLVHLYGNVCDMEAASAMAARHDLAVVEDAAQAHGSERSGKRPGGFGHPACYSFYPSKNLGALGDAGAVVTDDDVLAGRIRSLGNHGREPDAHDLHVRVGTNERLDALQAAFLRVKLPMLDTANLRRREIAAHYL
jgi:dTDP-3-amino-3,4,6-trideoxy-alpha-D-glucose transaminase